MDGLAQTTTTNCHHLLTVLTQTLVIPLIILGG
jgi:hypothetical protein